MNTYTKSMILLFLLALVDNRARPEDRYDRNRIEILNQKIQGKVNGSDGE